MYVTINIFDYAIKAIEDSRTDDTKIGTWSSRVYSSGSVCNIKLSSTYEYKYARKHDVIMLKFYVLFTIDDSGYLKFRKTVVSHTMSRNQLMRDAIVDKIAKTFPVLSYPRKAI